MSNTEKVRKEALLTESELCHVVEYIRLSPGFRDELLKVAQSQLEKVLKHPDVLVRAENMDLPQNPHPYEGIEPESGSHGYTRGIESMLTLDKGVWVKVDPKEEK